MTIWKETESHDLGGGVGGRRERIIHILLKTLSSATKKASLTTQSVVHSLASVGRELPRNAELQTPT